MSIASTTTNSTIAVSNVELDAGQDLDLVTNPPVDSNSQAQATVVTGDASAAADNITAGFKDLLINNVGQEALLNALVSGTTISSSRSVTGNTSSDANSSIAAGMTQTQIDNIGTNATILGQQTMVTNAEAGSISGDATANAVLGQQLSEEWTTADILASGNLASLNAVGGIVGWNNSFSIGQDGQVTGRSGTSTNRNATDSLATSVTGNSNASTQVPSNYGISLNELSIGQEGSVIGEVAADQSAQALTTTGDSKANVQTTRTAGLQVVGSENYITEDTIYTLAPNPSASGPSFTIGTNGSLEGKALLDSSATAKSVTQAGDGFGVSASVGGDLGPGGEQTVYGISLPGSFNIGSPSFLSVGRPSDRLRIGMDGSINAEASVTQQANAEVVTGSSLANSIASPNTLISGLGGNLTIQNNATGLRAIAALNGNSQASSVSGDAQALNGIQGFDFGLQPDGYFSLVNGIGGEFSNSVVIGADLAGGALLKGRSALSSQASTVTGDSAAFNAGQVFGSRSVNFDIGNSILNNDGSIGTALFQSIGSASAAANTITANAETGGAAAGNVMTSIGFVGTPLSQNQLIPLVADPNQAIPNAIEIGKDGNLTFSSDISSTSTASAITAGPADVDLARSTAGSVATNQTRSTGLQTFYGFINSPTGISRDLVNNEPLAINPQSVVIGGSGNVTSLGRSTADTASNNVTGSALANSANVAFGINTASVSLVSGSDRNDLISDITIGDTGSISATGINITDTSAATVTGESLANTSFNASGIVRSAIANGAPFADPFPLTTITAGPNGGSILGLGLGASSTESSSVTGDSTASTSANLFGLRNVNLIGGQVSGNNLVGGQAVGNLETMSQTVTGNADASSTATAAGISYNNFPQFDNSTDGSINVNGNINAIAQLSNTVTASTVTGNATATVTNSVVGLGNANITIGQSGSITASAVSNSSAIAQSITAQPMTE